jgi:tRNA pseudouridine65 synthase
MVPLSILYQDEFLVAIDKPAGMIVHPGREPEDSEWIAMKRLRDQLGQRVFPVHRLDRPTSGVLLFALDKKTAGLAQQAFEQRAVTKTYHAVVCGSTTEQWVCETPLRANPGDELLPAETMFERLAVTPEGFFLADPTLVLSLLKVTPATGRFHQIRRHLLESDRPIVGDFRYAGMERSHELGEVLGTGTRMLLQAKVLELEHPRTGQRLIIEAPQDPEFAKCFPSRVAERTVVLLDGTLGIVRPILPTDRDALAVALDSLDPESRYRRFFFDKKKLSETELTRLTTPDGVDHIAYGVAVKPEDETEFTPIAVGRCFRDKENAELAEIAIVTADAWQGHGAGIELMRSLSAAALEVGIRKWFASMLSDNTAIERLLGRFGKKCEERDLGGGVIEVVYEIVEPPGGFF